MTEVLLLLRRITKLAQLVSGAICLGASMVGKLLGGVSGPQSEAIMATPGLFAPFIAVHLGIERCRCRHG